MISKDIQYSNSLSDIASSMLRLLNVDKYKLLVVRKETVDAVLDEFEQLEKQE